MIYFFTPLIIILVISCFVIFFIGAHDKKKNIAYFKAIAETNKSVVSYLKSKEFNITQTIDILDFVTKKEPLSLVKKIFLDETSHKIALIDYNSNKAYISQIDDIYKIELIDHSDTSNGYLDVFHTKSNTCYYLYLSIYLKSNYNKQINYEIINRDMYILGIEKSNDVFVTLYNSALSAKNIIELYMSSKKEN